HPQGGPEQPLDEPIPLLLRHAHRSLLHVVRVPGRWILDGPGGTVKRSCLSAGERSRQPEPWEHAGVETGDGADPVAGEGQDQEARAVADAGRGAEVGPERRLTVGPRRYEVEPPAGTDHARVEASHDVAALV